mmetsp:Transcript_23830/g.77488  ORF Transcript_23830/g.77488 Transcript_23830/m.77488 type:complete len:268 (-) Transcript_23830:370-1173(-)
MRRRRANASALRSSFFFFFFFCFSASPAPSPASSPSSSSSSLSSAIASTLYVSASRSICSTSPSSYSIRYAFSATLRSVMVPENQSCSAFHHTCSLVQTGKGVSGWPVPPREPPRTWSGKPGNSSPSRPRLRPSRVAMCPPGRSDHECPPRSSSCLLAGGEDRAGAAEEGAADEGAAGAGAAGAGADGAGGRPGREALRRTPSGGGAACPRTCGISTGGASAATRPDFSKGKMSFSYARLTRNDTFVQVEGGSKALPTVFHRRLSIT